MWVHAGYLKINRNDNDTVIMVNERGMEISGHSRSKVDAVGETIVNANICVSAFLSVLNCTNVTISDVAAPASLNKRRVQRGAPPLYSYKTLVLKSRQARIDRGVAGPHESPRIHLRRGHVKRRKTGNFWWQPCVVGSRGRGIVAKEYRADQLVQSTCPESNFTSVDRSAD